MRKLSEEKKFRIFNASLFGAIFLLCFILSMAIYSFVSVINKKSLIEEFDNQILALEELKSQKLSELEELDQEWKILQLGRIYGLITDDDDE